MRNKAMNRILSFALAALLLGGVFAAPPMTAYAVDIGTKDNMVVGGIVLGTASASPTVIGFGGKQWAVIGYDSVGNTAASNTVTLLLANGFTYGSTVFDSSSPYSNEYSSSDLKTAMESAYNSLSDGEKNPSLGLVIPRDLEGGSEIWTPGEAYPYDADKIAGDDVDAAHFWPLSVYEARLLDGSILSYSGHWWLRSPGTYTHIAAVVSDVGYVYASGGSYGNVTYINAIRPAFKLNLTSVIFTSAANSVSGKSTATAGSGLVGASAPTGAIKLTVEDSGQKLDVYGLTGGAGTGKLTFSYNNSTATTGTSQYISCVLVNSSGEVKYYGKLEDLGSSASGTFDVPISGVADGTYTLKIFSEQANGDNSTDFCSTPVEMTVAVTGDVGTPTDTGKPTVSSVTPSGTGAAISGNIVITFSEAMNTAAGMGSVTLAGGAGTVNASGAWSNGNKTYTIRYYGLAYSTPYTISISGFQDVAGNVMTADGSNGFTTTTAPVNPNPPSGSGWYPSNPVSQPTAPKPAFPTSGNVVGKRIDVFQLETLKTRLFRLNKGDAFTVLGLANGGRALHIEHDGRQGYIALKDITAEFGAAIRATALKKAAAYVLWDENGKLTREGYFPKGQTLWIHGIWGKYLINKQTNATYYLDSTQWELWIPQE